MTRRITLLAALALGTALAAEEPPLTARVNRAIDRSAANLVARQAADGSFQKEDNVHPLGRTALCTFALLHAGLPRDHPAVLRALEFLGVAGDYAGWKKPRSTYEAACLVLMLNALGREHARHVREVCDWLLETFNDGQGLWGYPEGNPDLSNTQYAVLALKAGERHGHRAPDKLWKRLVESVLRLQAEGGAVRYRPGTMYRATMTHAALLVLKFAEEALGPRAPVREIRRATEAGMKWLLSNYSVENAPYGRGWFPGHYYYYMYGLERFAVFFGLQTIGDHDWYREGAEELLRRQAADGSWGSLEDTAFAILFLRRATLTEPEARVPGAEAGAAEEKPAGPPPRPRPDPAASSLREWLVAGPFAGTAEEDDFLFAQDVDPRRSTPVAGGPAGKRKWVMHRSAEDTVRFRDTIGEPPWSSFYAATYLRTETDADALLWFGSDDGLRVWLDGEEILFGHHHDHSGEDFYRVPVRLAGKKRHLLFLQVENHEYYAYFRVRISDAAGRPLTGVTSSASPP